MGPANLVDDYIAAADPTSLERHAVTVATDMDANHARAKGLNQLLSIAGVVAQVRDDQRVAVVARVNPGQGTGALTAIESLRQFIELRDAKLSRGIPTKTADHGG